MSIQLPPYLQQQGQLYRLSKARSLSTVTVDAITWIEREFYIPETNAPIKLVDYQKRVIEEALSKDDNGLFKYSTVLYSDLKKSAKSTISGAVALYLAWHNPYETVRVVGNDLKQADSRTFAYIKNAIELNPRLSAQCKINNYKIELPNKTVIHAIAVDPKGEAGGGDLVTCFTELWGYKNEASKKLWVETALSPLKFGKSLRWCETYAGHIGESPILEGLYEAGVTHGTPVDVGIEGLELFSNGRQLTLWNTRARCDWQTPAYYAYEATQYTPEEYRRIHENAWASSTDMFVPQEWWKSCEFSPYPEFGRMTPMVIAMDAAISGDSFGLVGVSRIKGKTYIRYVNEYKPPLNGKIDFEEPRAEVERLAKLYNVECVCFDPYALEYLSSLMVERGIVFMQPFNQSGKRLEADRALYDAIRERAIAHNGDVRLTQHIYNANRKTEGENKMRIVKRQDSQKIDLAVCLSMAHHTIVNLEIN